MCEVRSVYDGGSRSWGEVLEAMLAQKEASTTYGLEPNSPNSEQMVVKY